jgi:tRNA/tmRNA/rRNA uracil-C5-methylase (TrmA/RlmC/RlmD family)
MSLEDVRKNWDALGKIDPMWAILAEPSKKGRKWQTEEFFETGVSEIAELMGRLDEINVGVSRHKALDFVCGIGRLSQALARYFEEVHGVDIAPSMIQLAEQFPRR